MQRRSPSQQCCWGAPPLERWLQAPSEGRTWGQGLRTHHGDWEGSSSYTRETSKLKVCKREGWHLLLPGAAKAALPSLVPRVGSDLLPGDCSLRQQPRGFCSWGNSLERWTAGIFNIPRAQSPTNPCPCIYHTWMTDMVPPGPPQGPKTSPEVLRL